jgi:hypothetical protein
VTALESRRTAILVAAVVALAATAALVWRGVRDTGELLWSIDHGHFLVLVRPFDAQTLAVQSGGTRVQPIDPHTGKTLGAGWERTMLADTPAGQPAVLLELDATKRLSAVEIPSRRERFPVDPPCPEINAVWFASGGGIVGLGGDRIAHVTADGRCRVSAVQDTLNFWWAGIDSTGLVYVASNPGEHLYTVRPETGELQVQRGVAANEVLAVPSLPGAVVTNRRSTALFSGTREIWRTTEVRWPGPRAMARAPDFVGVHFDEAGGAGVAILKASDGALLERVRMKTGGVFAFAGRCLLSQDIAVSDWVTFRVVGTGVGGKLAKARLSAYEGDVGRVAEDVAFVQGVVLVQSGGHLDAYPMPEGCR